MEASALRYTGGISLHGRTPLLRLQSDERLVMFIRRGNASAFEVLVARYQSRLLAFCRHLLGSREDAEDVLQEVFSAAFHAMLADERPINVRPWLYRIARNRSLNHLRRIQAVGVDSMDVHFSDHGASTADKVHDREEFRMLMSDIGQLPETQRTALVLREMDALSYEQIAEAMETTVPSVKSLLVRARVSLAEAAEARLLSCDYVRIELGEVAEGLQRKPSPLVRRHLKACQRCSIFSDQLKETNKALAALMPIGPLVLLKKLVIGHLGHSAGASAGAGSGASGAGTAAPAAAMGSTAAAGSTVVGSGAGGVITAGVGAIATKAAAGLAAAALVTAGAVEVSQHAHHRRLAAAVPPASAFPTEFAVPSTPPRVHSHAAVSSHHSAPPPPTNAKPTTTAKSTKAAQNAAPVTKLPIKNKITVTKLAKTQQPHRPLSLGRTRAQTDPATVLPSPPTTTPGSATVPPATDSTIPTTVTMTTPPGTTTAPTSTATAPTSTTTTPTPGTTTTPTATTSGGDGSSAGGAPVTTSTTPSSSTNPTATSPAS